MKTNKRQSSRHAPPVTPHPTARRQARPKLRRQLQSRIARVPRKVARVRRGPRTVSLTLLALCVWAFYLFATSDLFYVSQIVIEGNATVPTEELGRASGAANYNVFFLQFGAIERNVNTVPGIAAVSSWYEWPNIVHIAVGERKPLFVWEGSKQAVWVDEAGVVFPARGPLSNTLVIRDLDNKTRVNIDPRIVASLKTINGALPSLKRLEYSDAKGLSFNDEHGWRVLLGQPEQIGAKLSLLQALSAYLTAQNIAAEYVDVRLPERAFYKPK
ncbi:MAG: FtsQ-type POTRA domain-containing protein [Chloroflexota bacterium]